MIYIAKTAATTANTPAAPETVICPAAAPWEAEAAGELEEEDPEAELEPLGGVSLCFEEP
jgi:hypothetical protein